MSNRIDKLKLNHWLNIRKTTIDVLNELLSSHLNYKVSLDNLEKLDKHSVEKIAEVLSVPIENILVNDEVPLYFQFKETNRRNKKTY